MIPWMVGDRAVCAALTAAAAALLGARRSGRTARALWMALCLAGVVNALAIDSVPQNLLGPNLVHYYLGAKYPFPYRDFYLLVEAARGVPPIGIRDLDHPNTLAYADARAQRAYFIDLLRAEHVTFDALAPLDTLQAIADRSGAVARASGRLLAHDLPAGSVDAFRDDVRYAMSIPALRNLTDDYGFNGSPWYALIRRADPTTWAPFGPAVGWLNLGFQLASVFATAWIAGAALGLGTEERLAGAALLLGAWEFAGFALPGLIFGELWIPVAVAVLAMRRRLAGVAGVAIAWAGLLKLFPFVLALPLGVRAVAGLRRAPHGAATRFCIRALGACALATVALGGCALASGRSWIDFMHKLLPQFHATFAIMNGVGSDAALAVLGGSGGIAGGLIAAWALLVLAALSPGGDDEAFLAALPRRALVVVSATGWLTHTWLNYYALLPCLLLPWYARAHRLGTVIAILAMAAASVLPDFSDPILLRQPVLHALKLIPFLAIPAWMVAIELRAVLGSERVRRIAVWLAVGVALLAAADVWRVRAARAVDARGQERLAAGDAAGALARYDTMTRLAPLDARAHMQRAIALATLDRLPEAIPEFQRAAALAPGDVATQDNAGRALFLAGRTAEAARRLERAHALAPDDTDVMAVLARVHLAAGRIDDARALARRARELAPDDPHLVDLAAEIPER